MDITDAEALVTQWRQYADRWLSIDPNKAARFNRLADQMQSMLANEQCTLKPIGKGIDLFAERHKEQRLAERQAAIDARMEKTRRYRKRE